MSTPLRRIFGRFLDLPLCLLCGGDARNLTRRRSCSPDKRDAFARVGDLLCSSCMSRLPYLNSTWQTIRGSAYQYAAVFRYEGPVREAVLRLKFSGEKIMADLFSIYAEYKLRQLRSYPKALVPIPLGRTRKRERGYNQVSEIAHVMARSMGVYVLDELLYRRVETKAQTAMPSLQARAFNVHSAFAVNTSHEYEYFKKQALIVLDDVTTSGATFRAAGDVLRQAGYTPKFLAMAEEEIF